MSKGKEKRSPMVQEMLDSPGLPEKVKRDIVAMETETTVVENQPIVDLKLPNPENVDTLPVVEEPAKIVDTESKESIVPAELKDKTPLENTNLVDNQNDDWEQKYSTLKGKFDAEVPRLNKALSAKDDVIEFYKKENEGLNLRVAELSKTPVSADVELPEKWKEKLADAGYDDDDDIELFQGILNEAIQPLQKEIGAIKTRNSGVVDSRGFDNLLVSNGFVDYSSMKAQGQFDFAMSFYKQFGYTAKALFDKAVKENDFDTAAEVLADVQDAMVRDGHWSGEYPEAFVIPKQPIPAASEKETIPKAVLPHSVKTVAKVPEQASNVEILSHAATDFQKGLITYEQYKAVQTKIIRQEASADTS